MGEPESLVQETGPSIDSWCTLPETPCTLQEELVQDAMSTQTKGWEDGDSTNFSNNKNTVEDRMEEI